MKMQALRDSPIRRKLMLISALTTSVSLLLACAAFLIQEYMSFRSAMVSQLAALADALAGTSTAALAFQDRSSARDTLRALRAERHVVAAGIYDKHGVLFAEYQPPHGSRASLLPPTPRKPGHYFEDGHLLLFRLIALDGEPVGTIYIRSDMQRLNSRLKRYAGTAALVMMASCLVAFVVSARLQRLISEPILRLASAARTVSAEKNYSVRVPQTSSDEIGMLIGAFNEMLSQIARRTEELSESEERFRRLFEEAPVAYHEIDREGIVRRVNWAECKLLGLEASEMIGKQVWEFVAPEERARSQEAVHQKISGTHPLAPFQRTYVRHDGALVVLEIHDKLIFDRHGSVTGIRSALLDITDRKRAAEALERQAKELARSNSELEQFAYIASHDLQEPLRKILAFGDRLKTHCGEAISAQARDYLERMQNAAVRMQALINDLLSLSRVQTRTHPFVPVNLSEVARVVVSDLEPRIEKLAAKVEIEPLPTIQGDPVQMSQLLQNLVGNALKFHRKDQPPVVKVRSEYLNGHAASPETSLTQYCQIMVEDNGIGFDEKYLDRIFQVFQRLHGRSEYEGTGIGLAVCRRIAERHGGSITASSAPGQGAKFIVTLPVAQPRSQSES